MTSCCVLHKLSILSVGSRTMQYKAAKLISAQFCKTHCEVLTFCICSLIFSSPACTFVRTLRKLRKVNFVTILIIDHYVCFNIIPLFV